MFGKKPVEGAEEPAETHENSADSEEQPTPPSFDAPLAPRSEPTEDAHVPMLVETERHNELVSTQKETQLVAADAISRNFQSLNKKLAHEGVESYKNTSLENESFIKAKEQLIEKLIDQIDFIAIGKYDLQRQRTRISDAQDKLIAELHLPLNRDQIRVLKEQVADELFGFGPLEPLLSDAEISDIMVNGSQQIYVEKQGKLVLTDVTFRDESHLLSIIQRIVSRVGRRIDESSPMVDARMPDGSRFNAIIPPLALDGSLVSIRKFKKNKMPLSSYIEYQSMSPQMAKFLEICGLIGLNMIVSGGTGSGKTTLLNALSGGIGHDERIVTIEDAAELQLQQPHVLRLETRPASMEGRGEITQRQLVKNALRMRPDRIILGEIRGEEVIDVLSAMNTGHDGSMATIHANNPRDCLARLENLVGMSGVAIGMKSLRQQIASAVQIIVQIERQRDGRRRITAIEEIVGMEGDIITTQTLFSFNQSGMDEKGNVTGEFMCHGIRPKMITRASYYGKQQEVLECFKVGV